MLESDSRVAIDADRRQSQAEAPRDTLTGGMSSFINIDGSWTGGNEQLLQEVLPHRAVRSSADQRDERVNFQS